MVTKIMNIKKHSILHLITEHILSEHDILEAVYLRGVLVYNALDQVLNANHSDDSGTRLVILTNEEMADVAAKHFFHGRIDRVSGGHTHKVGLSLRADLLDFGLSCILAQDSNFVDIVTLADNADDS